MNTVADVIRAEIAASGPISFARFMELALYCPLCGFYEKKRDTIGRAGDFFTSVSVGPLFGELLAFQFAEWLEQSEVQSLKSKVSSLPEASQQIVEAGAHDGRLAKDILNWLKLRRPALFERIEYWIVEPSAVRQAWQRETLRDFAPHVRWADSRIPHPASRITGIIFSNELLDAFPVHRLGWDAQQREWFEWGVTFNGGKFTWTRRPKTIHDSRFTIHAAPDLLAALPDGFTTEICPAAEAWWREAAGLLEHGRLLTLDYGLEVDDFFAPQRAGGTLRAYHQHHVVADLLANAGEQDITAHVNFTAILQAGESVGLKTEARPTQTKFLTDIAQRAWQEGSDFGLWTSEQTRQFQTLTHPEHLGRSFSALLQTRC